MSIPANSPWRGAAAFLPQPVDEPAAQSLAETLYNFNVRNGNLKDIEYRSGDGDADVARHVFRWDRAPYDVVFENGFKARRHGRGTAYETPDDATYYSLESYVNGGGGRPLDSRRDATHGFISTTISSSWTPPAVDAANPDDAVLYRYEIYAPGGILVVQTLGDLYRSTAQDEVVFPAGIDPQYIRSAQRFELTKDSGYTRRRRVDNYLFVNMRFNPQSHPQGLVAIQKPVFDYVDEETNGRCHLTLRIVGRREQIHDYYFSSAVGAGAAAADLYVDAAFRSSVNNEAHFFINGEHVQINYAPGTTDDRIIRGPCYIGSSFPCLAGTAFAEHGIDAAFGCDAAESEAFVFSGNLCAKINYGAGTSGGWIMEGPKTIRQMFPFFKGTSFENGIDAAFESTRDGEAYLFRGSEYALVHHDKQPSLVGSIRKITDGFQCLRDCTQFQRDIPAAFASHVPNEVYLFRANKYVLLHFTPGEDGDYIVSGPKDIIPETEGWFTPVNWPSLKSVLPRRNNRGLDVYEFGKKIPGRDHDEL